MKHEDAYLYKYKGGVDHIEPILRVHRLLGAFCCTSPVFVRASSIRYVDSFMWKVIM